MTPEHSPERPGIQPDASVGLIARVHQLLHQSPAPGDSVAIAGFAGIAVTLLLTLAVAAVLADLPGGPFALPPDIPLVLSFPPLLADLALMVLAGLMLTTGSQALLFLMRTRASFAPGASRLTRTWLHALLVAAAAALFAFLVAAIYVLVFAAPDQGASLASQTGGEQEVEEPAQEEFPEPESPASSENNGSFPWRGLALLSALIAAGVGALALRRLLASPPSVAPLEDGEWELRDSLRGAADRGLVDLDVIGDPRTAVVAAYAAMEAALTGAGVPPAVHHTPLEYMRLVVTSRFASRTELRQALVDLTIRYEVARFSTHPVTDLDRAAAIELLKRIQQVAAGGAA